MRGTNNTVIITSFILHFELFRLAVAARTPQPTGVVLSSASAGKIHVDDVPVHRGIANDYSEATSTGKQGKLEQGKKKAAPGIHYDEVPVHRGSSDDYAEPLTGVLSREVTSSKFKVNSGLK